MVNVTVNNTQISVPENYTVLQACAMAGVEVPRFCYHERLAIAGNCRMCIVYVENAPKKLVASCAAPAVNGMNIFTDNPAVKKAREGVMEFLLANHPLDCPICDQGGECDLQDQAIIYGTDRSRYLENKRMVQDKDCGPLIKTVMNRCIHCTRCVRFITDVAGVSDLGMTGRGNNSEIGTYIGKAVGSELSGNIIDLCPVGALTSKPYAFKARPWELKSTESIDIFDSVCSNTRIDAKGNEVLRIMPRINNDINEEWLDDRARFSIDGLKVQRLTKPLVRENGAFSEVSWKEAFSIIKSKIDKLSSNSVGGFIGSLSDVESMLLLKELINKLDSDNIYLGDVKGRAINSVLPTEYLFNTSLNGIEDSDVIMIVGSNPRAEAPLMNYRIRKAFLNGSTICLLGPSCDLTYDYIHIGNNLSELHNITSPSHKIHKLLKKAKKASIIVGSSLRELPYSEAALSAITEIAEGTNVISSEKNNLNMVHNFSSTIGALDINVHKPFNLCDFNTLKFAYLLGVDNDECVSHINTDCFVVYQGHHGDVGASRADIVLPGGAYTEKEGLYVNLEGIPQITKKAVDVPGNARDDWKILRSLTSYLGLHSNYDDLNGIKERLLDVAPHLYYRIKQQPALLNSLHENTYKHGEISNLPLDYAVSNYHMSNVVSKFSKTMSKCAATYKSNYKQEHKE